eukprot:ANDGO_02881.mRNA.1 DNA polymerase epsilon subunit 3
MSDEFTIPPTIVARLMKQVFSDNMLISKEARAAVARSTQVFVQFLTAAAQEFAAKSKRQTIFADDIFAALEEIQFASWVDQLKSEYGPLKDTRKVGRGKAKKGGSEEAGDGGNGGAEGEQPHEPENDGNDDVQASSGAAADADIEVDGDAEPEMEDEALPNHGEPDELDPDHSRKRTLEEIEELEESDSDGDDDGASDKEDDNKSVDDDHSMGRK